ncbi:MAG: O-antigen ligase family protein [Candidatus Omnitrophota bacterium]
MGLGIIAGLKFIAPALLYASTLVVAILCLSGRVRIGLYFLIPLYPLQNVVMKLHPFPLGKDLNDILLICMLIGWALSASMRREKFNQRTAYTGLLILTGLYTYFALWKGSLFLGAELPFNIHDPRVQAWKNYLTFPLLFFMVLNNIKNRKHVTWMLGALMASMFLMDYYTVDQIRNAGSIESRTRFSGTFSWLGPNEVAAFYSSYTFILIALFFYIKTKWMRLATLALSLMNTYCVLFLYSRGAYVAFGAGMALLALFRKRWLLIPLIVLALNWQTLLPQSVLERINQTQDEYGQLDASVEKRLEMWNQSMLLFQYDPIFGSGFNIFPHLGFALGDTHNIYLKFLAEQGLIGFSLLFILLIMSMRSGWKLFRGAKDPLLKALGLGFFLCTVSLIIGNFFGDRWTHLPLGAFFWVLLGMVERGRIIIAQEEKEEKEGKSPDLSNVMKQEAKKRIVKPWNTAVIERKQDLLS